jgi:hypothetical protein
MEKSDLGKGMMTMFASSSLPPPQRLLVDYQHGNDGTSASPTVAASERPHFSFVPDLDTEPPKRGASVSFYQVGVHSGSALVWDSGKLAAGSQALAVQCGASLKPSSYNFTAKYWDTAASRPSPEHRSTSVPWQRTAGAMRSG